MSLLKKIIITTFSILTITYLSLTIYALWPVEEFSVSYYTTERDHFIEVDGFDLRYIEEGKKDSPVLLLVHGFAGSVYTWREVIPLLSDKYRVIALDLPGFGLSEKPLDFDYCYDSQGEIVKKFIIEKDLHDVILVGHSMGGNITLHAARNNHLVSSLILMDPGIIDDGNPKFLQYLFFPFTRISAKLFRNESFRMSSFENSYYRPENITMQDINTYMIASKTRNYVKSLEVMLKKYKEPDELKICPEIYQPTLVLWGRHDRGNTWENGEIITQTLPNAIFKIIEEAGHYIHEEQPVNTVTEMVHFLKNL